MYEKLFFNKKVTFIMIKTKSIIKIVDIICKTFYLFLKKLLVNLEYELIFFYIFLF